MATSETFYRLAERRIELLSLVVGVTATLAMAVFSGGRSAGGFALGAALGWLNFRWLKQGVDAVARLATSQTGADRVRVPKRVYFKFFLRIALILAALYAIFRYSLLPIGAVLGGLFTPVAAILLELVWELFSRKSTAA